MYTLKNFNWSSHQIISEILIKHKAQLVLDVACGEGSVVVIKPFKKLVGLDKRLVTAPLGYNQIFQIDIETSSLNGLKNNHFEAIILADILEHLKEPKLAIEKLKPKLKRQGIFIISVPNMGFFVARILLSLGIRPKMKKGLFDKTHLIDFNETSILELTEKCGLKIESKKYAPLPLPLISPLFLSGLGFKVYKMANKLANKWPKLLAYQIIIVAR